MEKVFIFNRNNKKLAVVIKSSTSKDLVFIMHGLGGFKEQKFLQVYAEAFIESDFTVIMFDAANTIGESEGKIEDATLTNYYEDLEDVIIWASRQLWYVEPFWLVGHSFGGFCVTYYAEKLPEKIKAIAPTSSVISGYLLAQAWPKEKIKEWEKTGWWITPSLSKPDVIKNLSWALIKDFMQYDLLKNVQKLNMPVLLLVGENDSSTPVVHQQIFYDKLSGKKEIYIIKGAKHTFREESHLAEIKTIFIDWIQRVKNY
jgi:uncharacterized protein